MIKKQYIYSNNIKLLRIKAGFRYKRENKCICILANECLALKLAVLIFQYNLLRYPFTLFSKYAPLLQMQMLDTAFGGSKYYGESRGAAV